MVHQGRRYNIKSQIKQDQKTINGPQYITTEKVKID
jgi:hypothetical protein